MGWDTGNDDLQNRADVKRAQENQPLENGLDDFFSNDIPPTQPASSGFGGFGGDFGGGFGNQPQQNGFTQVNGFGNTINNGANPNFNQPTMQQNNVPSGNWSEKTMHLAGVAGKGIWDFLKQFKPYIGRLKSMESFHLFIVWLGLLNLGIFVFSFLLNVIFSGVFMPVLVISGFGFGIPCFVYGACAIFLGEKFLTTDEEAPQEDAFNNSSSSGFEGSSGYEAQPFQSEPVNDSWGASTSSSWDDDYADDEEYGEDDEFSDWDDEDDEGWDDEELSSAPLRTFNDVAITVSSGSSEVTHSDDSAFESKVAGAEMGADMVTRRGLFDKYIEVLDGSGTKADDVRVISPSSDEAGKIENFLNNAVEGMGLSQEDWVSVNRIEERTVIFSIATTRPNKLKGKEARFAEELTKVLKDKMSRELGESVYATAEGVGNEVLINIFKGIGAKVYLRDVLLQKREFFENPKNLLPVTFGFDEFGEPIVGDLTKMVHTLFSGNPNSGKSNLASSVVNQLVALNSPKQVQFVVGDAKDGISDWKMFRVPHFKRFESTPEGIVSLLDWIVEVEEPRRTKLISDMGVIKIQDYNELSETPLPYLFVVLDEVMTFSNIATPEQKAQYKRSLGVIVSKMRAVGIYMIAVPHRVVDDIFPASASALFGNRFAVKASEDVTKTVWKDAFRKIKFSISNVGDYAYTLDASNEPKFGHAPLLMDGSARTAKLYEQQRKMWSELYPDEVFDSQYERDLNRKNHEGILSKAGLSVSKADMDAEFKPVHDDSWIKDLSV